MSSSSHVAGPRLSAAERREQALEEALHRCGTTQDLLQHSIRSMKTEVKALWEEAIRLRQGGNTDDESTAAAARLAKELEADIRMVRSHLTTIIIQQRLIRRQKMTQMLTRVLVDTSRAMSVTQQEMEGRHTAAVDESTDVATRIFEDMASMGDVLEERRACEDELNEYGGAEDDTEMLSLLEQVDAKITAATPPVDPLPSPIEVPSVNNKRFAAPRAPTAVQPAPPLAEVEGVVINRVVVAPSKARREAAAAAN